MRLTNEQIVVVLLCVAIGTQITRWLPFVLFPESKEQPKLISYLSLTIPPAMMGLLVIYCLKDVSITNYPHGLSELIAIAVIIGLHKWKGNVLLSVGVGTILYMFLVQSVFI